MRTGIKNLTARKKAMLACGGILVVLLTGVLSAGILPAQQVTAQAGNQTGNFTGGPPAPGVSGKLKALDLASEILQTKIKVKLLQALQNATDQLGPDAHILKAELTVSGDDVVYEIVGLKEGRIHIITIDPLDGSMLDSKNFSLREIHEMRFKGGPAHSGMDAMMPPSMMGQ